MTYEWRMPEFTGCDDLESWSREQAMAHLVQRLMNCNEAERQRIRAIMEAGGNGIENLAEIDLSTEESVNDAIQFLIESAGG
jgi:hypothetical protein